MTRKPSLWLLGLAGTALLLLQAAGSVLAQQAPLRHEVSVTLKLVQVYVTDKSGRPVADLTRDDFRVFDGGKRVAVTEFERHEVLFLEAETAGLPAGKHLLYVHAGLGGSAGRASAHVPLTVRK